MACITISDLHPTGYDLFYHEESYLNELTDEELNMTQGGSTPACVTISIAYVTISIWYSVAQNVFRK